MAQSRGSSTPRSSSRSKRSTTNLSDLRLAPLSMKFAEPSRNSTVAKSPYEESPDAGFAQHHSSYIHGKSAPSTLGILSRSSSRKHLGGGLSRRGSLYEEDGSYQYAAVARDPTGAVRVDVGSGQILKAKSEAALHVQQRLSGQGVLLRRKQQSARSKTGTSTPAVRRRSNDPDNDWLTRTRASTHALLQEAKGQSWLASRESSTSLAHLDSDDDEDEGYEEMAAMSARNTKLRPLDDPPSPTFSRIKSPAWGSRYGSRNASRHTSRRGSMTNMRTPLRTPLAGPIGEEAIAGYFDQEPAITITEPDFVDPEEGQRDDETEVAKLTGERSFGLGGIVDRLMGFNLFKVDEREETTEDEAERGNETEDEVQARVAAEAKRNREERDRLTAPPSAPQDADEQDQGGWQDAAWLLSVASKALF